MRASNSSAAAHASSDSFQVAAEESALVMLVSVEQRVVMRNSATQPPLDGVTFSERDASESERASSCGTRFLSAKAGPNPLVTEYGPGCEFTPREALCKPEPRERPIEER